MARLRCYGGPMDGEERSVVHDDVGCQLSVQVPVVPKVVEPYDPPSPHGPQMIYHEYRVMMTYERGLHLHYEGTVG